MKIEQRLFESGKNLRFSRGAAPPREGPALLQGRAICGVCGQRMHIRYGQRRGERIPNYVCCGRGRDFGDALCQSVVGISIDAAVGKLVVDSVSPMALDLSIAIHRELQARADESDRLRYQSVPSVPTNMRHQNLAQLPKRARTVTLHVDRAYSTRQA